MLMFSQTWVDLERSLGTVQTHYLRQMELADEVRQVQISNPADMHLSEEATAIALA